MAKVALRGILQLLLIQLLIACFTFSWAPIFRIKSVMLHIQEWPVWSMWWYKDKRKSLITLDKIRKQDFLITRHFLFLCATNTPWFIPCILLQVTLTVEIVELFLTPHLHLAVNGVARNYILHWNAEELRLALCLWVPFYPYLLVPLMTEISFGCCRYWTQNLLLYKWTFYP